MSGAQPRLAVPERAQLPSLARFDVVVPSAGRASLAVVVSALAAGDGPLPEQVILVDDRRRPARPLLPDGPPAALADRVVVVPGSGRGPAAARNAGWRTGRAPWVAFLDDDVVPPVGWRADLAADLARARADVGAVQGTIRVPRPPRRLRDAERAVAGLEHAVWATADMAYRRATLEQAGGFDERFSRAYREDADLALRVQGAGWRLARGARWVEHPLRADGLWSSLRRQAGNADDVLMRALHGPDWRARAQAPPGRFRRHVLAVGAAALAATAAVAGRPRAATAAALGWSGLWGEFAWARIAPGPRDPREVAAMAVTSALIPPLAVGWTVVGRLRRRRLLADAERAPRPRRPDAVLFDRDGTLVVDVPYNGDPGAVVPVPGARAAVARLRAAGVELAVVSNQSGVARGVLTLEQVHAVNARVEELLGPLGPWAVCPHGPDDACACRKPQAGLVLEAAAALGVEPGRCAVVGDIGSDVEAAQAAGARAVLVPTPRTRPEEVAVAPQVAPDIESAVALLLEEAA